MPIDAATVPVLIKASEVKKLDKWKADYFEKVAKMLQVHTKGQLFAKVDTLFPNEHPASKAHCLNTYEPITKSSIWKGINNLLRIFSSSSFSIKAGEQLTAWLDDYETNGHNLLQHFLDLWVQKAVAEDPNGLFVIYPPDYIEEQGGENCPVRFVRSDLIKSYGKLPDGSEYVAFTSEEESKVEYYFETHVTHREVFHDPSVDALNGVCWTEATYNERLKVKVVEDVVHIMTRDGFIVYRRAEAEQFRYVLYNFSEPLSLMPCFPGGGQVADKADQQLFESFVHPFIPFGNLALLQHRNHRAVDLQFSYPRMSELQVPCDHPGCSNGQVKCVRTSQFPDGFMNCPKCGTGRSPGWITVQSPYKVYQPRYDPNDGNDNKHLDVDPVKFYSPDVGIVNYSKDAWKDYLKLGEEAIFIMQKVQTGSVQSEESKRMDAEDMHAWLLNVAKRCYGNMRHMLQVMEEYLDPTPSQVSVERPYSFAILTETEAFAALDKMLLSSAPIVIKANEVENFVNKFVSKSSPVIRALRILKQYDTLLFYSDNQVASFKASNVITADMVVKHVVGYPLMLKLYEQDKALFNESDEVIMTKLDSEVKALNIQATDTSLRSTLLPFLNNPANTPAA